MKPSYDDILRDHPSPGKAGEGEIELTPIDQADRDGGPYGVVLDNRYFRVVHDPVRFPNGEQGSYYRVLKGDPRRVTVGAAVVPLRLSANAEPEIGLVHQYRHPAGGWMAEIPRGTIEPDESAAECAIRELREETGLGEPVLLVHLGDLVMDSGDSPSRCAHFVAVHLADEHPSVPATDPSEAIREVVWRPFGGWLDSAPLRPIEGRPAGGIDAFTAAAVGLGVSSGVLARIEDAFSVVFGDGWDALPSVAPCVMRAVRAEGALPALRLEGTQSLHALIRRFLPRLEAHAESADTVLVDGASVAAVAWLAALPATHSVCLA